MLIYTHGFTPITPTHASIHSSAPPVQNSHLQLHARVVSTITTELQLSQYISCMLHTHTHTHQWSMVVVVTWHQSSSHSNFEDNGVPRNGFQRFSVYNVTTRTRFESPETDHQWFCKSMHYDQISSMCTRSLHVQVHVQRSHIIHTHSCLPECCWALAYIYSHKYLHAAELRLCPRTRQLELLDNIWNLFKSAIKQEHHP